MNDLPLSGLAAVNVGDTVVEGDTLVAEPGLTDFNSDFVGHIARDTDELVVQGHLAVRDQLGYLVPSVANALPSDFSTADWMHGRYALVVRPDARQRTGIPVQHAV